ncbi:26085_t:CDS:2, partial [Dentiscutata erythropus]
MLQISLLGGWRNIVNLHGYLPEVYEDTRKVIMNSLSENLYKCTTLKTLSVK